MSGLKVNRKERRSRPFLLFCFTLENTLIADHLVPSCQCHVWSRETGRGSYFIIILFIYFFHENYFYFFYSGVFRDVSEYSVFRVLSTPAYSISFNSSNVGNYFWSWMLKLCIDGQEEKEKVVVLCSRPPQNMTKREIRHFHVVFVKWQQRNVQKSVICFPKG